MARVSARAAVTTVAILSWLSAASASAVGGLAFVHAYRNGDMGIDGIGGPRSTAVSPDGASLYVNAVSPEVSSIAVFRRDAGTGRLTEVQVVMRPDICTGGLVTVSPDGASVYLTGSSCDTLAVFQRDTMTGTLTFLEVHQQGIGGDDGLDGVLGVTVSPDGANVYVTAVTEGAVAVFARDSGTGRLTFVEVQKNGMNAVSGLSGAADVAIGPDGQNAYVASRLDNAVAVFSRSSVTGALTFLQVEREGVGGVDGLGDADAVRVSADGRHVYATGINDSAVAVFARDVGTGFLTFVEVQRDGTGGVPPWDDGRC